MDFKIVKEFENDKIIICKRINCRGEKRYFEHSKLTNTSTGREFKNKTEIKKYIQTIKTLENVFSLCNGTTKNGWCVRRIKENGGFTEVGIKCQ